MSVRQPIPEVAGEPIPPSETAPPMDEESRLRRATDGMARALHARTGWGALVAGLQRGFHPQLLLAWVIVLLLPALVAALPIATWLHLQLGHLPQAREIASGRETALLLEALRLPGSEAALLGGSTAFSLLLALALSPWLSGMIVAQIRTVYRLRMGGVLRAGLGEYPRMLRMLLWSVVPIGGAAAVGLGGLWLASIGADRNLIEAGTSGALLAYGPPLFAMALLLLVAHCTVETARAWLGADLALRSVVSAWKCGVALLRQRPFAVLVVYLGTSVVGYGLALAFAWLRLRIDGSGWLGGAVAFALTQLVVASLAWGRSARLHGLADLATAAITSRAAAEADETALSDGPPMHAEE